MGMDFAEKSLHFFDLSHKFLKLSIVLIDEMINHGNQSVVILNCSDDDIEDTDINQLFSEKTQYSDFNIMVPLLFNLYHGLELYLKGSLLLSENMPPINHNSISLLEDLEKNYDRETACVLKRYIKLPTPISFIKAYCEINEIKESNQFYLSLRYPSDKQLKTLTVYYQLGHHEKHIIDELQQIKADIEWLIKVSVIKHKEKFGSST